MVDVIVDSGTSTVATTTVPYESTVVSVGSIAVTIGVTTDTAQESGQPTTTAAPSTSETTSVNITSSTTSAFISSSTLPSSSSSSVPGPVSTSTLTTSASIQSSNFSGTTTTFRSFSTTVINGTTSTSTFYFPTLIPASNSSETSSTEFITGTSASDFGSLTSFGETGSASATAGASGSSGIGGISASGGSATSTAGNNSSSAGSGSSAGSNSSTAAPTPQIVGGVVGGVAGLALILVVILYLLRSYRKKMKSRQALPPSSGAGNAPSTREISSEAGSQNALAAAFLGRWGHSSQPTIATAPSDAQPAERGFQKLGGRKLTGVLAGGDPYGGNYGAFEPGPRRETAGTDGDSFVRPEGDDLRDSSFYRDSRGFHGGPGAAGSPMQAGQSETRDFTAQRPRTAEDGLPVMRPSPARTPVQATASVTSLPRTAGSSMPATPRLPGQDGVGRSLSAHDGSRGSRFTESV